MEMNCDIGGTISAGARGWGGLQPALLIKNHFFRAKTSIIWQYSPLFWPNSKFRDGNTLFLII